MKYNTQEEKLRMPAYGRLVQRMAERAMTIEDRDARNAYAVRTVQVMGRMTPKLRGTADFQQKLWNHLAYICGYELDIDYPVTVERHGERPHPARLPYPQSTIRYRHYGHLLERAIEETVNIQDERDRERRVYLIANRMKRNLAAWKGDGATDEKVARDIDTYTQGNLSI